MTPDDTTSTRPPETPLVGAYAPPPPRDKYAFISYKSEDRPRVEPIVKKLRKNGIPVWWDRDIEGGKPWPAEIKRHLDEAEVVVAVWSELSVSEKGDLVQEEARTALEPRRLLPVTIDSVKPPFGFGSVQAIDLSKWRKRETDPAFVALVTQVGAKLNTTLPPLKVDSWLVRLVQRFGIASVVGAVAITAAAWGAKVATAGPTAADLYGKMNNRTLDPNDRAKAIGALLPLQRSGDSARLTTNHRRVVEFLAWRTKRLPQIECTDAASTLKAAELRGQPDVVAAVAYLRSNPRTRLPADELSLDSVNLQKQDFTGADLRHTTFKAACLDGATFTDTRLESSNFVDAHIAQSSFARARLDSAQLGMAWLEGTSWFDACLRHASFAGANLKDADLHRATITWANFSDAYGRAQSGWDVVDATSRSHALFVGTKDVTPEEHTILERAGASFTLDFGKWDAQRATAAADTGTGACRRRA